MRRLTKVSLVTGLLAPFLFAAVFAAAAPKKEYFTEDELDLIRDAQELGPRVSTYFKLADRRLIFLGIKEKSQEQIEKERKEREKRLKEQKKSTDTRATANKAPIDDTAYLDDFTHAELLRGYIQVLDEVTDNIDNAFTSRQDVRDPLEDLAKFTRESLPLLEKYKPKNDTEKVALQDAIDRSKEVAAQTKEALSQVPKTEKKRK
jgi:hypothetical protein